MSIIYEDDALLILDKPAGITVNNSDTTKGQQTVQDFVERKFSDNSSWLMADKESDFYKRAGIVHRIDKETSGILIIAKNPDAFEYLQAQFKERKVQKTYLALVHGLVSPRDGEIVVPVGRLPWNRKMFGVIAEGREAVTNYNTISNYKFQNKKVNEDLTFLELNPKTGRTHQIRVHLKHINRPIFSDFLYAGRKTARDDRKLLNRVFLHAHKISFFHPVTHELISFESPLPEELSNFIKNLS